MVVVGGGLAASRTCVALRTNGFDGEIVLVGDEAHLPYDRPPLSKAVLHGTCADTTLPDDLADLGVQTLLGTAATDLRLDERVLVTTGGEVGYDGLVIAVGAAPIRLPGDGEQLTVRTIDDARVLAERLRPGNRIVVVGASWIGAEVATAARTAGCRVTCVEAARAPAERLFGDAVAQRLLPWWEDIDLRLGAGVDRVEQGQVVLSDGTSIPAAAVVVGVGVRPNTDWLESSGLELDRGVLVDERLVAAPGVVAVGDVAARWSPRWNTRVRNQHWDNASNGPAVAASSLLGDDNDGPIYDPVPYFWSDQFGHKLQYVGHHAPDDTLEVRDPAAGPGWSACWSDAAGRTTAVLAVDRPREIAMALRTFATQDAEVSVH